MNVSEYTIEHVMPQNPNLSNAWQEMLGSEWEIMQDVFLHTLGNLTLTGYNSELSDSPFAQKKTMEGGFNDSPIRLNEFLRKTDVWNGEQIQNRAKTLAIKAKEIWFAPKLSEEELNKYKHKEKKAEVYSLEHYEYLEGELLELYNHLRKRITNIDSSVTEEYKKLYIAFKSVTNFVDIVPQKIRLRLSLNMEFSQIIDPKNMCKDVSELGRWGNGQVEVGIDNINELEGDVVPN